MQFSMNQLTLSYVNTLRVLELVLQFIWIKKLPKKIHEWRYTRVLSFLHDILGEIVDIVWGRRSEYNMQFYNEATLIQRVNKQQVHWLKYISDEAPQGP